MLPYNFFRFFRAFHYHKRKTLRQLKKRGHWVCFLVKALVNSIFPVGISMHSKISILKCWHLLMLSSDFCLSLWAQTCTAHVDLPSLCLLNVTAVRIYSLQCSKLGKNPGCPDGKCQTISGNRPFIFPKIWLPEQNYMYGCLGQPGNRATANFAHWVWLLCLTIVPKLGNKYTLFKEGGTE